MTKMSDLTGKKFGRYTVKQFIGLVGNKPHNHWECICDCGNIRQVSGGNLKSGLSKSCGCLQKEKASIANTKHGSSQKKSKEYTAWTGMRKRCNAQYCEDYKDYGARGITVCERWDSFANFHADMGDCPTGYSLDRIDVNKGYSPENCRWADAKTQARNKTNTRWITYNGITKALCEWAELSGTKRTMIDKRINRGWSIGEAIYGRGAV
jgi:hypothetical protein